MFYELPLVAFTVLAQTAVGAHLTFNAYEALVGRDGSVLVRRNLIRFIILCVMGVGFLFSTTHLGSPLRAFNAFNRVGGAALSNEILTGASFLTFAGLYWLMSVLNIASTGVRQIFNLISIVIGVVFMFAMANVYDINTVPAWHSVYTAIEFAFTVLTLGVMFGFGLITLFAQPSAKANRIFIWLAISLVALHLALITMQTLYYVNLSTAIQTGLEHVNALSGFVIARVLLMVVAIVLWLGALLCPRLGVKKAGLVFAFIALTVAELLGRNVFYGMHFTSGLY